MKLVHQGKVRDVYEDGDELVIVASDRVSVYDVTLPTEVPDKGKILTALALWWFDKLAGLVPNHVISADDVPAEFAGRAMRVRKLRMLPVECIARGYLAGLGAGEYKSSGTISGVSLPPGLELGSKLPEPIFTPTTKATEGHDEFITYADVESEVGGDISARLKDLTLTLYKKAADLAYETGIIIADTKFEFGLDADGRIVLADEIFTSDSSRFWPIEKWRPGQKQHSMDKQFVRDWSLTNDWDKTPPGPEIPADIVAETRSRYVEVYERITGEVWKG